MKLLTANRLNDGVVMWYTPNGWVEDAALATRLEDAAADALQKEAAAQETLWVGVYSIPLNDSDAPVQREWVREYVRANGPTIGATTFDTAKAFDRDAIF